MTTKKSILITGGSGYFGNGLVRHLLSQSEFSRICIYSRNEHTQADMRVRFDNNPRLRWFIGDVRDLSRLTRAAHGVDLIVHCAALKRIEACHYNPDEMVKTNVNGAMNVISAARLAGVPRVVALSSDKAYQPVSAYGQSKALAESLFVASNYDSSTKFSCVRYGNVWNSSGSVVPTWRKILESGHKVVPVTDPDCTRFFMTLQQAVDLVMLTAETMLGGEIAIPDLPAYRLGDLAQAMGAEMDIRGLNHWEKRHESMDEQRSSDRARRMTVDELRSALQEVGYG